MRTVSIAVAAVYALAGALCAGFLAFEAAASWFVPSFADLLCFLAAGSIAVRSVVLCVTYLMLDQRTVAAWFFMAILATGASYRLGDTIAAVRSIAPYDTKLQLAVKNRAPETEGADPYWYSRRGSFAAYYLGGMLFAPAYLVYDAADEPSTIEQRLRRDLGSGGCGVTVRALPMPNYYRVLAPC